jgi:hypothetical protein
MVARGVLDLEKNIIVFIIFGFMAQAIDGVHGVGW